MRIGKAVFMVLGPMVLVSMATGNIVSKGIGYEFKLYDTNNQPLNGAHTLYVSIYRGGSAEVADSGTLLFSETATSVTVNEGVASYVIGAHTATFGGPLSPNTFHGYAPDTQAGYLQVAVDTVENVVLPRTLMGRAPFALEAEDSFKKEIGSYVTTEIGDSATSNGQNLLAAYAKAKALTPNGLPLSATNRATLLVTPGNYDMTTGQLYLDTEFVDLVGMSSTRDDQVITGLTNGSGTGVVAQFADDVRIQNLVIEIQSIYIEIGQPSDPAAYFPESNRSHTRVTNCEFRGPSFTMRAGTDYTGTYIDCKANIGGFGYNGNATGTFVRCTAEDYSFGFSATAGGTFTDCIGGKFCFGYNGNASGTFIGCAGEMDCFGDSGQAGGTFTRCTGGDESFGGIASGTFTDCRGGDDCFANENTASGTFTNCTGGGNSFGGIGLASGMFTNCTGGGNSYGGNGGEASGTFIGCTGGDWAFAGFGPASGTFRDCTGGAYSFGGGTISGGGTTSGTLVNCTGASDSFGSHGSTLGGRLINCRMTSGASWTGTFSGRMENCYFPVSLTCSATARIYGSIITGVLDLNHTAAGVTGTRANNILGEENNIFGSTSAVALNLEDPDVN